MNHVGLPFYQEFGNKGGRRGLSQTCKEAVSVLKQQFREPRFQAILFYIHCLVAIQRNGDFRPEWDIDTIAQGNTVGHGDCKDKHPERTKALLSGSSFALSGR